MAAERRLGRAERIFERAGDFVQAFHVGPDCVAVRAALDLVEAVKSVGVGLSARAGVLTGEAAVNIARDGTYTYSPDFTVNMQTPAGPASGQLSGTSRGTWSISGTNLITTETSNNITGVARGSFGSVPLPRIGGFGSMTSQVKACNAVYFEYEVSAPTGSFTQRVLYAE